ncbi:MAG TPA: hypothetical protein PLO89_01520 [Spirochaetota bacterium]|nr:hypothetical protein [Spirochaetota bacterium]
MKNFNVFLFLFFSGLFLFSSTSNSDWIKVDKFRWSDSRFEYFVGQSDFTQKESDALEASILNAKKMLSEEILSFVKTELKETIRESDEGTVENAVSIIESKSSIILEGVKVLSGKSEEKGFGKNKRVKYKSLIKLTKEEYEEILNKPKKDENLKIQSIKKSVEETRKMIKSALIQEAISSLEKASLEISELIFFGDERMSVVNLINELCYNIAENLKIEILNNDSKLKSGEERTIIFKYDGKPVKGLKVKIFDNEEFIKADFNNYSDSNGAVLFKLNRCLKFGSFSIFIGADSFLDIFKKKGIAFSLEGETTADKVFFTALERSFLENGQKISMKENYFDREISGYLLGKSYKISETDPDSEIIKNYLSKRDKKSDFYMNLGMLSGSRIIISGDAFCEISSEGDGVFSGKPKVNLVVYDVYSREQIANYKFEVSKKIVGKSKEKIAESGFKELRGQVIRFLEKNVLTRL